MYKHRVICDLLRFKVAASLKSEVSRYRLNYLWWILEPVLSMLVFYLVFGIFLNRGMPNYVGFLLTGLTGWNWFNRTVMNAAGSINNGSGLMLQVDIPKLFFPIEAILRDMVKQTFAMSILLIFLVFYTTPVSITWFALPVIMVVQALLTAGVGVLAAGLVPFLPDLRFVISTLLNLMFFGSGVFYNISDVVLPKHQVIMYMNPIAGLLEAYRNTLLYAQWPDWWYLAKVAGASCFILWAACAFVAKYDHIYPRICQK